MYFRVVQPSRDAFIFQVVLADGRVVLSSVPFTDRAAALRAIRVVIACLREGVEASLEVDGDHYYCSIRGQGGAVLAIGARLGSPAEVDTQLADLQHWVATVERFRVEEPPQSSPTAVGYDLEPRSQSRTPGLELLQPAGSGLFSVRINDERGEVLLYSPGFPTRFARDEHVEALVAAVPDPRRYDRREAEGRHYFVVHTKYGRELARSRWFDAEAEVGAAIAWLTALTPADLAASARREGPFAGFEGYRGDNGQHFFRLNDERGEALVASHGYASAKARDNGIRSLLRAATDPTSYRLAPDGVSFTISALNGRQLVHSREFASFEEIERATAWIRREVLRLGKAAGIRLWDSMIIEIPPDADDLDIPPAGADDPVDRPLRDLRVAPAASTVIDAPLLDPAPAFDLSHVESAPELLTLATLADPTEATAIAPSSEAVTTDEPATPPADAASPGDATTPVAEPASEAPPTHEHTSADAAVPTPTDTTTPDDAASPADPSTHDAATADVASPADPSTPDTATADDVASPADPSTHDATTADVASPADPSTPDATIDDAASPPLPATDDTTTLATSTTAPTTSAPLLESQPAEAPAASDASTAEAAPASPPPAATATDDATSSVALAALAASIAVASSSGPTARTDAPEIPRATPLERPTPSAADAPAEPSPPLPEPAAIDADPRPAQPTVATAPATSEDAPRTDLPHGSPNAVTRPEVAAAPRRPRPGPSAGAPTSAASERTARPSAPHKLVTLPMPKRATLPGFVPRLEPPKFPAPIGSARAATSNADPDAPRTVQPQPPRTSQAHASPRPPERSQPHERTRPEPAAPNVEARPSELAPASAPVLELPAEPPVSALALPPETDAPPKKRRRRLSTEERAAFARSSSGEIVDASRSASPPTDGPAASASGSSIVLGPRALRDDASAVKPAAPRDLSRETDPEAGEPHPRPAAQRPLPVLIPPGLESAAPRPAAPAPRPAPAAPALAVPRPRPEDRRSGRRLIGGALLAIAAVALVLFAARDRNGAGRQDRVDAERDAKRDVPRAPEPAPEPTPTPEPPRDPDPPPTPADPAPPEPTPPEPAQVGCPEGQVDDPAIGVAVAATSPGAGRPLRVLAATFADEGPIALQILGEDGVALEGVDVQARPGLPASALATWTPPDAGEYRIAITAGATRVCHELRVGPARRRPARLGPAAVWPVERAWTPGEEALYAAWLRELFAAQEGAEAGVARLDLLTRDPAHNLLHGALGLGEDRRAGVRLRPDGDELPYFLRAYWAWKRRLPFVFRACPDPRSGLERGCDEPRSNLTANRRRGDELERVRRFFRRTLPTSVSAGNARTAHGDPGSDLYPVAIDRRALRPGTLYVDPRGQVLVVVDLAAPADGSPGALHVIGGRSDGALARRRFWEGSVVWHPDPVLGGTGFKRFRPVERRDARVFALDDAAIAESPDHADLWTGHADLDARAFHDAVSTLLAPPPWDPALVQREAAAALLELVRERVAAVERGAAYAGRLRRPIEMPRGLALFDAAGAWDRYATPGADLRLLGALDVVRALPERVRERPASFAVQGDPAAAAESIDRDLDAALRELRFTYRRSDGSEWELSLADLAARSEALEKAYNPNDCPELRWGAPADSDELSTCSFRAPPEQQARMEQNRDWFRVRRSSSPRPR